MSKLAGKIKIVSSEGNSSVKLPSKEDVDIKNKLNTDSTLPMKSILISVLFAVFISVVGFGIIYKVKTSNVGTNIKGETQNEYMKSYSKSEIGELVERLELEVMELHEIIIELERNNEYLHDELSKYKNQE